MTNINSQLFIGLMSGTSLDGIDGVIARFQTATPVAGQDQPPQPPLAVQCLAAVHHAFAAPLRTELLALQSPTDNELARAALAANGVARAYAAVVAELLKSANLSAGDIAAIGAHGQTVRHSPQAGYTVQLLNAALLAELSGIAVVHDLRSRDIAAGGQGAPLVPAFHAQLFAAATATHVVCNLGGIANISVITPSSNSVIGFDTGPGNGLMDLWAEQHLNKPFDANGGFAASGQVLAPLLDAFLAEPYFAAPAPKSTGRDLFNAAWLASKLSGFEAARPEDVQATLAELTATSVARAIALHCPSTHTTKLWLCGGGAFNSHLAQRLAALTQLPTSGTSAIGVDEQQMEALAFAWLARAHIRGEAGNLPSVTGAQGARVLGSFTPGLALLGV